MNNLLSKLKNLKKKNKTIGLVHGVFDVVHLGHINYFKEAKKIADILIVSVTADKYVNKGPNKPLFNLEKRVSFLKSIKEIDFVIKSNYPTSIQIIEKIKPNFYIKGKDYKENRDITNNLELEKKAVEKIGGKIIFTNSELYSSSRIINTKFDYFSKETFEYLKKIDAKKTKNKFLKTFENKINDKILIIGDPIIDTYKYVSPSGKSNKSNTISTLYSFGKDERIFGGSLLVANVLSNFSKNISIVCFENENKNAYKNKLNSSVKKILVKSNLKIINKIRFLDEYSNSKLFQVTENENLVLEDRFIDQYINVLKKQINKHDFIFVFDFGYNAVNERVLNLLNKIPKSKKIINCQTNSYNYGFNNFLKYKSADLMFVDMLEFRLGCKNKIESITSLIRKNSKLLSKYNNTIITLGKNGSLLKNFKDKKIIRSPSIFDLSSKDTIGCGDVFASIMSILMISKKFNIIEIKILSHLIAGLYGFRSKKSEIFEFKNLFKLIDSILK